MFLFYVDSRDFGAAGRCGDLRNCRSCVYLLSNAENCGIQRKAVQADKAEESN